jgi:hypothetical protein
MNYESEIERILDAAQTGDFLCVRSTTVYGASIRRLLSFGPHKAVTNHNAPVWRDGNDMPMMLEITSPNAKQIRLSNYLEKLYKSGGRAILVRPDVYCVGIGHKTVHYLFWEWTRMVGKPYDKTSIRQILRRYLRYAPHRRENSKETIYCTEGTFLPYATAPEPWTPDELKNEPYPAPIHVENMIRQGVGIYVAGSLDLLNKITNG